MCHRHWAPRRGTPAWRWACHRKRFGFAGGEVGEMPAGFLSAPKLNHGMQSHLWTYMDGETKYQRLYSPVLQANTLQKERRNPLFNEKNPLNLTILKAKAFPEENKKLEIKKFGLQKRLSYPGFRPLGGLRSNQNWV